MKWYNIWSWPAAVIDDYRQWRTVKKAIEETEVKEKFKNFKYEMRVDKIGRIYTVINIPEELLPYEYRNMVWPWVLEQLREIDDLLLELRLNDLVYPDIQPLEEAPAYIVKLVPSTESLSIWKFLIWLKNVGILSLLVYISNNILHKTTGHSIIDLILSVF